MDGDSALAGNRGERVVVVEHRVDLLGAHHEHVLHGAGRDHPVREAQPLDGQDCLIVTHRDITDSSPPTG